MGGTIDKMLSVMDADNDGAVSALELREWLLDEQFLANPVLADPTIRAQWEEVSKKLEAHMPPPAKADSKAAKKEYKQYSRHEITEMFNHMKPEDQKALSACVLESESARRNRIVSDIFKQLDVHNEGKVSGDAVVTSWIRHEPEFKKRHHFEPAVIDAIKAEILGSATTTHLTQADLERYFARKSLRQIRLLTTDLMGREKIRGDAVAQILAKLDPRNTGVIDAVILDEWIKDETFADNVRLLEMLRPLEEKVKASAAGERKGAHTITREELVRFMDTLPPMDFFYLAKQVLTEDPELLDEVMEQVFETMDRNGDGTVSRAEVMRWVRTESYFKAHAAHGAGALLSPDAVSERLAQLPETMSLADLQTFFRGQNLRHMRMLTTDLIRRHRIAEVFAALDVERKGYVMFPQIEAWMAKESYFQHGGNQVEKREFVLRKLEITRTKPSTLIEMQEEFTDWTLSEIRRITHDLIINYRASRTDGVSLSGERRSLSRPASRPPSRPASPGPHGESSGAARDSANNISPELLAHLHRSSGSGGQGSRPGSRRSSFDGIVRAVPPAALPPPAALMVGASASPPISPAPGAIRPEVKFPGQSSRATSATFTMPPIDATGAPVVLPIAVHTSVGAGSTLTAPLVPQGDGTSSAPPSPTGLVGRMSHTHISASPIPAPAPAPAPAPTDAVAAGAAGAVPAPAPAPAPLPLGPTLLSRGSVVGADGVSRQLLMVDPTEAELNGVELALKSPHIPNDQPF